MGEHAANQKTVNQVTTAWKSKHSLLSRLLCAAPLSSSRLSVPFAWQAKQRPLQLLWDTHLIRGMGLKAWFLLAFCSKTKKKTLCLLPVKSTITFADSSGQEHTICRMVISFETATSTNEQKKWEVDTRQSQNHAPGTWRVKKQNWLWDFINKWCSIAM